jgi:hypothetical protein
MLVKPGCGKVIPLASEFVRPRDGAEEQDCELAATKRRLAGHGEECSRLKVTVPGGDLRCHEPFCLELLSFGLGSYPGLQARLPPRHL